MEINVRDEQKIVEVWLTGAEREDPAIQAHLQPLYAQYKSRKYTVAVYCSGGRDLYQSTLDLLIYNKRRCAELEARRATKGKGAALQR